MERQWRLKILSVNNTSDIYGASRCLERVFGRFADDQFEVHVVVPEHGPLVDLLKARGIIVHIHSSLATIDRAQLSSFLGIVRFCISFPYSVLWLSALILRQRIDVVHTNTVVMPTPALAAFITRRKHVWHVRELLSEFGSLWKPFQRFVHFFSAAIVAISECVKDQFDVDLRDKVYVIYDGVDDADRIVDPARIKAFRDLFPAGTQLVGVVGRIKWHRKGQEILVRAASLLKQKHPMTHYVVIGSASPGNENHVTRLRELIAECHLDDAVTLLGDRNQLSHLFAAFDIAVVPSVQAEPFGCVVMEAMAVGTPVVGSRCGGIAEQIVDGKTGFLFPPGDAEGLSVALDRLLSNTSLRQSMGEHSRIHVGKYFQANKTYREMVALFRHVLADSQPKLPQLGTDATHLQKR